MQTDDSIPDDVLREALELAEKASLTPYRIGPKASKSDGPERGIVAWIQSDRSGTYLAGVLDDEQDGAFLVHAANHYAAVCRELLERRQNDTPAPADAGRYDPQPRGNAPPGPALTDGELDAAEASLDPNSPLDEPYARAIAALRECRRRLAMSTEFAVGETFLVRQCRRHPRPDRSDEYWILYDAETDSTVEYQTQHEALDAALAAAKEKA